MDFEQNFFLIADLKLVTFIFKIFLFLIIIFVELSTFPISSVVFFSVVIFDDNFNFDVGFCVGIGCFGLFGFRFLRRFYFAAIVLEKDCFQATSYLKKSVLFLNGTAYFVLLYLDRK